MNAAAVEAVKRLLPRLAPDGFAAAFVLSFLATAGFFYVNIMGALVSGLVDGLHLSPAEAGRIGAYNVYGAALGAFCAVLIVRRIPSASSVGVTPVRLESALDVSSMWAHFRQPPGVFCVSCTVLAGGMLVGISYAVIARTRLPDRCFGVLMVVQSELGRIGAHVPAAAGAHLWCIRVVSVRWRRSAWWRWFCCPCYRSMVQRRRSRRALP